MLAVTALETPDDSDLLGFLALLLEFYEPRRAKIRWKFFTSDTG